MCSDRRDAKKELDNILEELLDSIQAASPEEIAEDVRSGGRDIKDIAAAVKGDLLAAVRRFEQRKLRAARAQYESRVGTQRPSYTLPGTAVERRTQLMAILTAKPEMKRMLTVQHRDFENLTDEDVESALEELGELGLFGGAKESKSE